MATILPVPQMEPKECPWCHKEPSLIKERMMGLNSYMISHDYRFYVTCMNLDCPVQPKTKAYDTKRGLSEQDCINMSINHWNSRSDITSRKE